MQSKILSLNGKDYEISTKINFGSIVEMEEYGVDLMALGNNKQTFTQIRNITAFFLKISIEEATKEINEHLENGGKLKDLFVLFEVLANSDFFQKLAATQEE